MMLTAAPMRSLPELFQPIDDPRRRQGRRHALPTVLALATAATLCGMRGDKTISEWVDDLSPKGLERLRVRRAVVSRFISWDPPANCSDYSDDGLPGMTEQSGTPGLVVRL